jgi:hypothetical protein
VARLGAPEEYVAELRAAANLARRRGPLAFARARRPRDLAILAAVVLAAAGLTTVLVIRYERQQFVQNYQPLRLGNLSLDPRGAHGFGGINGEGVDVHVGRPFALGVEVVNVGDYAVRVLGVSYPNIVPWHAQLEMGPVSTMEATSRPLRRFHSFDLPAHQYVFLVLKGVYWCTTGWVRGNVDVENDFPVRYRFHLHVGTAAVPLPEPISFDMVSNCPSGGIAWPKH